MTHPTPCRFLQRQPRRRRAAARRGGFQPPIPKLAGIDPNQVRRLRSRLVSGRGGLSLSKLKRAMGLGD